MCKAIKTGSGRKETITRAATMTTVEKETDVDRSRDDRNIGDDKIDSFR